MQAITFNKKVWDDLESLKDYAKQNIIGRQEMEAVAAGVAEPTAADPKHQRFIPGGYRVIFSIHDWADGTRMRLFTLQHVTERPAWEICNVLIAFLGFHHLVGSPSLQVLQSNNAIVVMEMYIPK